MVAVNTQGLRQVLVLVVVVIAWLGMQARSVRFQIDQEAGAVSAVRAMRKEGRLLLGLRRAAAGLQRGRQARQAHDMAGPQHGWRTQRDTARPQPLLTTSGDSPRCQIRGKPYVHFLFCFLRAGTKHNGSSSFKPPLL